jgi:hypothetical protein
MIIVFYFGQYRFELSRICAIVPFPLNGSAHAVDSAQVLEAMIDE